MNSATVLRVLVVSEQVDARSALRWCIGHAFVSPDVQEVESVSEALRQATSERVDCVVADAALSGFADDLPDLTDRLWQHRVPLIALHDGLDAAQKGQELPRGIAACLAKASLSVRTVELAVRKAVELSALTRQIDEREQEIDRLRGQLAQAEEAAREADLANASATEALPSSPVIPTASESPPDTAEPVSATPDRPRFVSGSLNGLSQEEKELAGQVQQDLMPPGSPLVEGLEIAGLSIPAETTGGDYYDYLPMAGDQLCVSIGECSGRGLAPAMMMASLRAYLRVLAADSSDISDVLSKANTFITEDIGDEEFIITLMLIQIDQRSRKVRYASAGHQAFLIHENGQSEILHSTGMPLGLQHETVIPEGDPFQIGKKDVLLLASDGVQKMTAASGEQFGTDRMLALVSEQRELPARVMANYLRKSCTEFAKDQAQADDVTIVIVKGHDS